MGPWDYRIEWKIFEALLKFRIAPKLGVGLPVVHVLDVAEILVDAGEDKFDRLRLNAVSPYYPDLCDLFVEGCKNGKYICFSIKIESLKLFKSERVSVFTSLLKLEYKYNKNNEERSEKYESYGERFLN